VSYLSLAPAGDAFVAIRSGQPWLVTLAADASGATAQVPIATTLTGFDDNTFEDSSFGAAWTDSFVAIRSSSGVEVFDRKQPKAPVWSFTTDRKYVIGALPLANDVLAIQTQTGIRLYDKTGALIGGADPMPEACALDYQPHNAAVVAPDIVALSGKRSVYQFKVTLP